MSDDERSDSSSDSEDLETTGLIATRQKRATAGNLYATLRANLDDEELQKELLAEDEEDDAGEYEGSDKGGDDDDDLESSSEDEDAGPPKEGEPEDLDGEKALKRQERVEARKKRKLHDARLKLPAWQKKRVKLGDDVKTEDGSTSERPRKKSERSNWLPTAIDAPVRQSGRSSAIANREIVHANLKQSAERSERQRQVMKDAATKEKSKRRMTHLSQEDRLKKCERIEKETAKDFGKWEREEAERQRLREEALAAKRKRGLEGPFSRYWSGSVLWEGDNIKVGRMEHGSKSAQEIEEDAKKEEEAKLEAERRRLEEAARKEAESKEAERRDVSQQEAPVQNDAATAVSDTLPDADADKVETVDRVNATATTTTIEEADAPATSNPATADAAQAAEPNSLLQGIQEYATQSSATSAEAAYTPSAPSIHNPLEASAQLTTTLTAPQAYAPASAPQQGLPPMYHGWPPGSYQFPVEQGTAATAAPPAPAAPLIREQAQRTLLILDSFPTLTEPPKKIPKYKQVDTTLEADPLKKVLLPSAFPVRPTFTADETKYFLSRPRKRGGNEVPLPAAPPKPRCALTSWQAKYRDPKTGLAYADMHQYKAIQRVLAGGCAWSGLLGCWVGSSYGPMGRPAKGVPEAFAGHAASVKKESA